MKKETSTQIKAAVKVVKERSKGICECCGNSLGTNMHHRKNRSQGGLWSPDNLLHLCGSGTAGCHGYITEHPAESYAHGWSVKSGNGMVPEKIPVKLCNGWHLLYVGGGTEWLKEHDAATILTDHLLIEPVTLLGVSP